MTIRYSTTKGANKAPKILVYGKSGIGKTRLCATAPKPIIISSENKLTSISDFNIPVIQIDTISDFEDAIIEVNKKKNKKYICPCVDSLSDIAEAALSIEKKNHKDPRKAYGVIQDQILDLLRQLARNDTHMWYFIAKLKMVQNEDNVDMYQPKMPGNQVGQELPYIFDYVFPMKSTVDEDNAGYTYLQTNVLDDWKYEAKDSSGKLDKREKPDLTKLFKKIIK